MPLTWPDRPDDRIQSSGPSPFRFYARTRTMPLTCERTTGFEPATLTLARRGKALIVSPT